MKFKIDWISSYKNPWFNRTYINNLHVEVKRNSWFRNSRSTEALVLNSFTARPLTVVHPMKDDTGRRGKAIHRRAWILDASCTLEIKLTFDFSSVSTIQIHCSRELLNIAIDSTAVWRLLTCNYYAASLAVSRRADTARFIVRSWYLGRLSKPLDLHCASSNRPLGYANSSSSSRSARSAGIYHRDRTVGNRCDRDGKKCRV